MSAKLFLSYASEDKVFAERIANSLRKDGMEISSDQNIDAGSDLAESIQTNLGSSDGVVVILSEASMNSSFVMMELGAAKALDKRVVAIRSNDAGRPSGLDGLGLHTLDASIMSIEDISHTIQARLAS